MNPALHTRQGIIARGGDDPQGLSRDHFGGKEEREKS
jgi:hypothetical protein